MSIKGKLIVCFSVMLALITSLAALSYYHIETINRVATEMRASRLPAAQALTGIQVVTLRTRVNGSRVLSAKTQQQKADALKSIQQRLAELQTYKATYASLLETDAARNLYKTFEQQWATYLDQQTDGFAKAERGDLAGAQEQYNTTMSDTIRATIATLVAMSDLQSAAAAASGATAIAMCHANTTSWDARYFQMLNATRGEEICHFMPRNYVLWLPAAAL